MIGEGKLLESHIALRHPELRSLSYDVSVLKEAMEQLPEESPHRYSILYALNAAANEMYDYTDEEAVRARAILKPELAKKGSTPSMHISAIGHAHIDLAWRWPIRETIRKGARTFSTMDRMMERYPDYKFGVSQPQLLVWMKQFYPALFERLKVRAAEGRLECQGAMWVEPDTNLAGGKALVRQIL
jgi:alpha-mannosidase